MILFSFLFSAAIAVVLFRDLFAVIMISGIYSLVSASLFVMMDAADVAFTEAAVGAGISTLLLLKTLALTRRYAKPQKRRNWLALSVVSVTGCLLIYGTADLPAYGSADAPAHQHLSAYYLEKSVEETGVPNVVTAILASYRGFDTMGELVVIFIAGVGVLSLISPTSNVKSTTSGSFLYEHTVLRIVSKMLMPLIMMFALYVQFHGDYGPGGGFQAGVIFASAIILYSILFGPEAARTVMSDRVTRLLAAFGILLYAGTGFAAMLNGGAFLDYTYLGGQQVSAQMLGIFLVELGVGITVAAVMVRVFLEFDQRPVIKLPVLKEGDL
ncbi:MAG: multicomponent Na+:H+ antiporter subunit B [Candidatus Azotimanducaceae bacterium]